MHFQAALCLATKWVDAMWRYAFKHRQIMETISLLSKHPFDRLVPR